MTSDLDWDLAGQIWAVFGSLRVIWVELNPSAIVIITIVLVLSHNFWLEDIPEQWTLLLLLVMMMVTWMMSLEYSTNDDSDIEHRAIYSSTGTIATSMQHLIQIQWLPMFICLNCIDGWQWGGLKCSLYQCIWTHILPVHWSLGCYEGKCWFITTLVLCTILCILTCRTWYHNLCL